MNLRIRVVDDEPDVEVLFRQQFRRDLRESRFERAFNISAYRTSFHSLDKLAIKCDVRP